jgi:hypothetical protein
MGIETLYNYSNLGGLFNNLLLILTEVIFYLYS